MRETKRERTYRFYQSMERLGVDVETADRLRRIEKGFSRWDELECGTGEGQVSHSVERDDDGKCYYRIQFPTANGYHDSRTLYPDKEAQLTKRLGKIMAALPHLVAYHQGDCRGPSLYLVEKEKLNGDKVDEVYTRGVAVCVD
jgi:hypothetical protein